MDQNILKAEQERGNLMDKQIRCWLKEQRKPLVAAGVIVLIVLFIMSFVGGYWFQWGWVGVTEQVGPNVRQYQPLKTLWDWLSVLAIPVVVGFGVAWFTARQTNVSMEASDRQHKTELEIASDGQHEAALQTYIDKMSELLANDLLESPKDSIMRKIARVRTLTVLRQLDSNSQFDLNKQLDSNRKLSILLFLYETGLIDKDKSIVDLRSASLKGADLHNINIHKAKLNGVDLGDTNLIGAILKGDDLSDAQLNKAKLVGADLSEANLSGANLSKANLFLANLSKANLHGVYLKETNLSFANLSFVNLSGAGLYDANLSNADLEGADMTDAQGVTDEQLSEAKSLKGATMPNGKKHP